MKSFMGLSISTRVEVYLRAFLFVLVVVLFMIVLKGNAHGQNAPARPDPTGKGRYMQFGNETSFPDARVFKNLPAGAQCAPAGELVGVRVMNSTRDGFAILSELSDKAEVATASDGKIFLCHCARGFNELFLIKEPSPAPAAGTKDGTTTITTTTVAIPVPPPVVNNHYYYYPETAPALQQVAYQQQSLAPMVQPCGLLQELLEGGCLVPPSVMYTGYTIFLGDDHRWHARYDRDSYGYHPPRPVRPPYNPNPPTTGGGGVGTGGANNVHRTGTAGTGIANTQRASTVNTRTTTRTTATTARTYGTVPRTTSAVRSAVSSAARSFSGGGGGRGGRR